MDIWPKAETIAAVAAVVGLVGAAFEYWRQKRQSRLELAQRLIEQFRSDEMIAFAVTSLDWGDGIIPVPVAWRDAVNKAWITPDPKELVAAVEYGLSKDTAKDPLRLLYRHSFVSLFDHLERIEDLRLAGAVTVSDLQPMVWIAEQLDNWLYNPYPGKPPFRDALNGWYAKGKLLRLIETLVTEARRRKATQKATRSADYPPPAPRPN